MLRQIARKVLPLTIRRMLGLCKISKERTLKVRTVNQSTQKVEKLTLIAPSEHTLDICQASHPLYDQRLPMLSSIISTRNENATFVDIGANIGDTIALCRLAGCRMKIVAVEPSKMFFPILKRNLENNPSISFDVRCFHAFVGNKNHNLLLEEKNGTAGAYDAPIPKDIQGIPILCLAELRAKDVSLIKIDTDGYDATIILGDINYLEEHKPIIWAEAYVRTATSFAEWGKAIEVLTPSYRYVAVFDNFGFLIFHGELHNLQTSIKSLLTYIHNHWSLDFSVSPPIYYLDIAFFPNESIDTYQEFLASIPEASGYGRSGSHLPASGGSFA